MQQELRIPSRINTNTMNCMRAQSPGSGEAMEEGFILQILKTA